MDWVVARGGRRLAATFAVDVTYRVRLLGGPERELRDHCDGATPLRSRAGLHQGSRRPTLHFMIYGGPHKSIGGTSRDRFSNHISAYVGQTFVAAIVPEGEARVIESEQVQNRGVDVVHV